MSSVVPVTAPSAIGGIAKVLLHCFAGCSVEDVLERSGLTFSDLREMTRHPMFGTDTHKLLRSLNRHEEFLKNPAGVGKKSFSSSVSGVSD